MYQVPSEEDLYQSSNQPATAVTKSNHNIDIVPQGSINKIVVDGKELLTITPSVIDSVNRQHQQLRQQLMDLQMRHQRLLQQHNLLSQTVVRLEKQMERKVDYD